MILAGFAISLKTTGKSLLVHIQGNIVQVGFLVEPHANFSPSYGMVFQDISQFHVSCFHSY